MKQLYARINSILTAILLSGCVASPVATTDPVASQAVELLRLSLQCKNTPNTVPFLGNSAIGGSVTYDNHEYLGDDQTFVDKKTENDVFTSYNISRLEHRRITTGTFRFSDIGRVKVGGSSVNETNGVSFYCKSKPGDTFYKCVTNTDERYINGVIDPENDPLRPPRYMSGSYTIAGVCDRKTAEAIKVAAETLMKRSEETNVGALSSSQR